MAIRKPHSDCSDEKRTPKFVGEIQVTIDNDSCKSISSIARDMGVFEFLTRQVVHEEIRYFSYKIRNDQFLSHGVKNNRKDSTAKFLNKLSYPLITNMFFLFLR